MRRLIIGSVTALFTPDEVKIMLDDRQELVQTMTYSAGAWHPSVVVHDGGVCENGEKLIASGVKFKQSDWATIYGYWLNRTAISVTDLNGTVRTGCRLLLTGVAQSKQFETVTCDFEVWKL